MLRRGRSLAVIAAYTGQALTSPLTKLKDGNSGRADAATALDDNGTGTTTK